MVSYWDSLVSRYALLTTSLLSSYLEERVQLLLLLLKLLHVKEELQSVVHGLVVLSQHVQVTCNQQKPSAWAGSIP